MKTITHENRRRLTILTIVSLLVVAIITTTLILTLRKDTTAPTSTIEVGKRIDTTLGGGRTLLNASVWDGSSSTIWTNGSGTETDPYLIESASNLAYLRDKVNFGNTYSGMYFMQTVDIDLDSYSWVPIGMHGYSFNGNYDGNNLSINNIFAPATQSNSNARYYAGLFCFTKGTLKNIRAYYTGTITVDMSYTIYVGGIAAYSSSNYIVNCQVYNLSIEVTKLGSGSYFGGIAGSASGDNSGIGYLSDCVVDNFSFTTSKSTTAWLGGIVGSYGSSYEYYKYISNNIVRNTTFLAADSGRYLGGVAGRVDNSSTSYGNRSTIVLEGNYVDANTTITGSSYAAGLSADANGFINIYRNCVLASITGNSPVGIVNSYNPGGKWYCSENYFGGSLSGTTCYGIAVVGSGTMGGVEFTNNLLQGTMTSTRTSGIGAYGLVYGGAILEDSVMQYNISNADVVCTSLTYYPVTDYSDITSTENYYNANKITATSTNTTTGTSKTSSSLKLRSTFDTWTDFDTYWIIDDYINNGYPFLRAHLNYAPITGFDGAGTEAEPFQIKTTADLQGMQSFYNDFDEIQEYWWILVNDLDISVDANNLAINWCPIGYEGGVVSGFNGHFDGNGKTISGLTITEQYKNVGLFGRLASNATIKYLNIFGTINWDQATNVGGVVGSMEDGAKITNCSFTGTIAGYLNSGNYAAVGGLAGSYSLDAITGRASYDSYVYGTNNYTSFSRVDTTYTGS